MMYVIRRVCAVGLVAMVMGLALASVAAAQGTSNADGTRNATHLGGPTSFYTPPLRTAAGLKQYGAKKGMADDIRLVLRDSGIADTADAVVATLSGAAMSVKGAFCDEATPADGVIVECDVRPGTSLLWMAYRPNATKGSRTPSRLERLIWAGKKPFKAFLFRVTNDYKIYTFVVPLACGNLSLMSVTEIPGEPVAVVVDRVCDPMTGSLRATVSAASKDLVRVQKVSVAINGQPAGDLTASSWTLTSTKAGDYTFDATDTRGRTYAIAPRTLRIEVCPAPLPLKKTVVAPICSVSLAAAPVKGGYEISIDASRSATGASGVAPTVTVELRDEAGVVVGQKQTLDGSLNGKIMVRRHGTYRGTATVVTSPAVEVGNNRYEGTATCEATVEIEKPPAGIAFFFDVLGGKERRVRPIDGNDALEFGQCSPLIGGKVGIAKKFKNDWEIAGAAGVAVPLVSAPKVQETALFVDAEVNKHLSGGVFLGTGLSLWDVTRGDTVTPAWLLHFGIPLSKGATHAIYFMGEGRLFFDGIGEPGSNYLLWAGLRIRLGR